jgi:hypothetical protein
MVQLQPYANLYTVQCSEWTNLIELLTPVLHCITAIYNEFLWIPTWAIGPSLGELLLARPYLTASSSSHPD